MTGAAALFFIFSFTAPSILARLNKGWIKLCLLLFAVVSAFVLGHSSPASFIQSHILERGGGGRIRILPSRNCLN